MTKVNCEVTTCIHEVDGECTLDEIDLQQSMGTDDNPHERMPRFLVCADYDKE